MSQLARWPVFSFLTVSVIAFLSAPTVVRAADVAVSNPGFVIDLAE